MRGILRKTGEWHALKFVSRDSYLRADAEAAILQQVRHPNVVPLIESFKPTPGRPWWVLAMPEADFTLHDYLQRSVGTDRASPPVVRDLACQLLLGMACIHSHGLMHRDIKPQNLFLSVRAPDTSQGGLRLWIGDFSRARTAPPKRRIRLHDKRADAWPEALLSAQVCTWNYCAPEALLREDSVGEDLRGHATYGQAVDIWSFGTVVFEMLFFKRFAPGHTGKECFTAVLCRLGSPPGRYGLLAANLSGDAQRLGLRGLEAFKDKVPHWASAYMPAVLSWLGECRPTASRLHHAMSQSEPVFPQTHGEEAPPLKRQRRGGFGAECVETRLWSGGFLTSNVSLVAAVVSDSPCACAGHCYTPGHRYRGGCASVQLLLASSYCRDCACKVRACGKPRLSGPWCSLHKGLAERLPPSLTLTRSMGDRALHLMPAEVVAFLAACRDVPDDLAAVLVCALLKEPLAVTTWVSSVLPTAFSGPRCTTGARDLAEGFVANLVGVAMRLAQTSPASETRQLRRQGSLESRGRWGVPLCRTRCVMHANAQAYRVSNM